MGRSVAGGYSLLTGEPLDAVAVRSQMASTASTDLARAGCLAQAANAIWVCPAVAKLQIFNNRTFEGNRGLVVLVYVPIAFGLTAVASYGLQRVLKRPDLSSRASSVIAAALLGLSFFGCMASLLIGLWAGAR
jgi:hypothetical protein